MLLQYGHGCSPYLETASIRKRAVVRGSHYTACIVTVVVCVTASEIIIIVIIKQCYSQRCDYYSTSSVQMQSHIAPSNIINVSLHLHK